jgi:hypothetical protein
MTSYLDNKNMTTIEEEVEEEVKDQIEVDTGGKVLGYREQVEDCVKPSVTLPMVIPPCSISFTFRICPEQMRFFGKINYYRRRYGEEEAMDLYVEKLVIVWLNYMRKVDPQLADLSNICVGIIGTSSNYSPPEALFPCDTSYKEKNAFDFYYDAWIGEAYFNGELIKKVWV